MKSASEGKEQNQGPAVVHNSGHTPGPWIVRGYRVFGPPDPRSKHMGGRMLVGGVVDDMNDWRAAPSETREERAEFAAETAANARLIAAAPDLLAALEEIRGIALDPGAPRARQPLNECLYVAIAALRQVAGP